MGRYTPYANVSGERGLGSAGRSLPLTTCDTGLGQGKEVPEHTNNTMACSMQTKEAHINGWMDDAILRPFTVFQSYQDDERVHYKKYVDFTAKYLASGCQFFYRYFYGRLPVEHFRNTDMVGLC